MGWSGVGVGVGVRVGVKLGNQLNSGHIAPGADHIYSSSPFY